MALNYKCIDLATDELLDKRETYHCRPAPARGGQCIFWLVFGYANLK